MLAERVKIWTEEWKRQGLQEGRQEGMHLGEAKVLRRQLMRRFGTLPQWAEEQLENASEADLEQWADRVLDCERLDAVFDKSP